MLPADEHLMDLGRSIGSTDGSALLARSTTTERTLVSLVRVQPALPRHRRQPNMQRNKALDRLQTRFWRRQ